MDDKIHVKVALEVFGKIAARGKKIEDGHILNGIKATSDFDGYTIVLSNDYAKLTIFFHNKFTFEYSSNKERDNFLEKISLIKKQAINA